MSELEGFKNCFVGDEACHVPHDIHSNHEATSRSRSRQRLGTLAPLLKDLINSKTDILKKCPISDGPWRRRIMFSLLPQPALPSLTRLLLVLKPQPILLSLLRGLVDSYQCRLPKPISKRQLRQA